MLFRIKFPLKCIFRIFHIWKINRVMPFCNLFMERPLYIWSCGQRWFLSVVHSSWSTLVKCLTTGRSSVGRDDTLVRTTSIITSWHLVPTRSSMLRRRETCRGSSTTAVIQTPKPRRYIVMVCGMVFFDFFRFWFIFGPGRIPKRYDSCCCWGCCYHFRKMPKALLICNG